MRVAIVRTCLGDLHRQFGQYDIANELLMAALAFQRERGDQRGVMHALEILGHVRYHLKDIDGASACFHESLTLAHTLETETHVLGAMLGFAGIALEQGQAAPAARILAAVDKMYPSGGKVLEPADAAEYRRMIGQVKHLLDSDTFADGNGRWTQYVARGAGFFRPGSGS